jgi:uncharacterized protein (DUF433 family)
MATQEYHIVSGEESDIHNEPHLRGSRVTIRNVRERVEVRGDEPVRVAERLDLDVADIYEALAYYHATPEEMRRAEARHERAATEARSRSTLSPPE